MGILDNLPGSVEMAACVKCGRTDLADPVVSEDRPHDVQFHGYRIIDLSDESRVWASAWPRYVQMDRTRVYLAATVRFSSVEEMNAAVATAAARQAGTPLRDKLTAAGIPVSEPPASLPEALAGFVEIWNGLQLNDETPVDELLDAATRFSGPNRLAEEVLAQRRDLRELALRLMRDFSLKKRDYGRYIVKAFGLTGEDVLEPIRSLLGSLDDNKSGEMESICSLLRSTGLSIPSMLPDLEAAADRVKGTDYYTHKELTELIERGK